MKTTVIPQSITAPIADKTLWCGEGKSAMSARIKLYRLDGDQFELWTTFGGSVPVRHQGTLEYCNIQADLFISERKSQGFVEQLPSYNEQVWIA